MKLSVFDLDHLNYWNRYTCTLDDDVYDVIVLNYGAQNLELPFKFKRFKSLCYHDSFRDYGSTFSKSIEYIELLDQLERQAPYLMNIYRVEPDIIYGIQGSVEEREA